MYAPLKERISLSRLSVISIEKTSIPDIITEKKRSKQEIHQVIVVYYLNILIYYNNIHFANLLLFKN